MLGYRRPATSFSPVTSVNVGISHQNVPTFSFQSGSRFQKQPCFKMLFYVLQFFSDYPFSLSKTQFSFDIFHSSYILFLHIHVLLLFHIFYILLFYLSYFYKLVVTVVLTKVYPASIYFCKVNNGNTRKRSGICSKLIIKTPE